MNYPKETRLFGSPTYLSFLAGAIAGAGLALLFAPRSGKETRTQIADAGKDLSQRAYDTGAKAVDSAKALKDSAERVVSQAASKLANALPTKGHGTPTGEGFTPSLLDV